MKTDTDKGRREIGAQGTAQDTSTSVHIVTQGAEFGKEGSEFSKDGSADTVAEFSKDGAEQTETDLKKNAQPVQLQPAQAQQSQPQLQPKQRERKKREPKRRADNTERKMYDVLKLLRYFGIGCFILALILLIAGLIQEIIKGDTAGIIISFVVACVAGGLLGFLLKRK